MGYTTTMKKLILILALLLYVPTANNPETKQSVYDMFCYIAVGYHESRSEPIRGIHAVWDVVYNRSIKTKTSICSVVLKPKQFTSVSKAFNRLLGADLNKADTKGLDKVLIAYTSYNPDLRNTKIMWYHTVDTRPYWSAKLKKVKTVGKHVFYKE